METLQDMSDVILPDKPKSMYPVHPDNLKHWEYCGQDCQYTLSVANTLLQVLKHYPIKLQQFYFFQQYQVSPKFVTIMNKGTLIDVERKEVFRGQFQALLTECESKFNYLFNEEVNLKSGPQVKNAFKTLLGITPIKNRKTKAESFGSDAMLVYLEQYPEWRTILTLFLEYKSIGVFVRTFLSAEVDEDKHMRCDYNVAGTKTYRLASRKNVFRKGMNLANIPAKGKIDLRVSLQEYASEGAADKVEVETETNFVEELFSVEAAPQDDSLFEGKISLPNCKTIFLPENKAWLFFDADYSAIDLHFVVWESACEFLKKIIREGKDVYSVLASHYYQREIVKADDERQIFKSICHGCVTADHEVLTKDGWIFIDQLLEGTEIAVWSKDTKEIWFEAPKGINRDFVGAAEDLYSIEGAAFSFLGTQDHKFPYTTDAADNIRRAEASKLPKSARIPYNGNFIGGVISERPEYMQLMAALQADGSINHIANNGDITFRFNFVKERKIIRLRNILLSLNVDFKEWRQTDNSATSGNVRTCFSFKNTLTKEMKYLGWWILDYDKNSLLAWKNELEFWDGHVRKSNGVRTSVSTTDALAAEVMQTVIHLCGQASKVNHTVRDETRKDIYEVSMNNRAFHNMATGSRGMVKHNGTQVFCPQTSTGYFLIRRKGNIYVSGNTNYLGTAPTLAAKAGLSIAAVKRVIEFYFSQCPEILEWHKFLENHARQFGYIENCFGARNEVFDFTDKMWLNKLVAWQPQSSAAILVNNAIVRLEVTESMVANKIILPQERKFIMPSRASMETKLQTHDSISGQAHIEDHSFVARLMKYMEMPITFDKNSMRSSKDTVIIPAEVKISNISYGDCAKIPKDSPYQPHLHQKEADLLEQQLLQLSKQNKFNGLSEAMKYGLITEEELLR